MVGSWVRMAGNATTACRPVRGPATAECSLHKARIIHGANANTSDKRRAGYTMRYFPTSLVYADLPANKGHKLWLARGKDIAGNTFVNA
jgi:hypothetical protein